MCVLSYVFDLNVVPLWKVPKLNDTMVGFFIMFQVGKHWKPFEKLKD